MEYGTIFNNYNNISNLENVSNTAGVYNASNISNTSRDISRVSSDTINSHGDNRDNRDNRGISYAKLKGCSQEYVSDSNDMRYVGWRGGNECVKTLYSPETIRNISNRITALLEGVDPEGRHIRVPDATIQSVLSDTYQNYVPPTGDIYSRFIISSNDSPDGPYYSYFQHILNQTITLIVATVKTELGIEACNQNLTIWNTLYGAFNKEGLQQTPKIKVRERNTNYRGMVSFMSY